MPRQISKKISDNQNVYIGLDVHLKNWSVSIIQAGVQRKSFSQPALVSALVSYLDKNYSGMNYYSAYESGFCGLSLHYDLVNAGIKNIVFNPADISQKHKEGVRKTDAVDAKKIARNLYDGELDCIHIPDKERYSDRSILRLRQWTLKDFQRQKIRLKLFLHAHGISTPAEYSTITLSFLKWLDEKSMELSEEVRFSLMSMVKKVRILREELKEINKKLISLIAEERYKKDYELLRTIPGLGRITAITILLECGDLKDFSSADKFCAFVGLIPDCDVSGDHTGKTELTKRRHKTLRYMFTQCAWVAIRKDNHLSKVYAKATRRMNSAKAIVIIANKLARIVKFVLKNKKGYEVPK